MRDYSNFADLVDACQRFHDNFLDQLTAETLDTRRKLAEWIRKFHYECGTLTPQVERALKRLDANNCLLLMTAHQPNLFAYSGVLRKATLNQVLAEKLSKILDLPVVSFFGLADQDFADDRWVKSAQLVDVERRNATLELRVALPERIMLNKTAKPSEAILNAWEKDIDTWIHRKIKSIAELSGVHLDRGEYLGNLRELWGAVRDSHSRANNSADFSAFVISQIVNSMWEYDTLFCRFSECQQIFEREFKSLIDRFWQYSQAVREAEERSRREDGGVYGDEHMTIPVWYHCECGSKARLTAANAHQGVLGRGHCLFCGKQYDVDFSSLSRVWSDLSRISARALAMPLVFFDGLAVCGYVGGAGGKHYLQQARYVADQMSLIFPPVVVWRPHDRYLGLGQLEALLTIKKLVGSFDLSQCKVAEMALRDQLTTVKRGIDELEARKKEIAHSMGGRSDKIGEIKDLAKQQDTIRRDSNYAMLARHLGLLENSRRVLGLYPCVVDYGVNLGLRNVAEQWEAFLRTAGDLGSEILLRTKIDERFSSLDLQEPWPSFTEDRA
jgi:hypothetical protein